MIETAALIALIFGACPLGAAAGALWIIDSLGSW